MTAATETPPAQRAEKAIALALRLAHAQNALHAFASGQIDAIVDLSGKTYLLHPTQVSLLQAQEESAQREGAHVQTSLLKDRFLAMLSHELRTPLSPVLLGVAELEEDERFVEARPILAMIRRNIALQSRLLEELLDFTTLGQHKVRLQLEAIDVHEAIRSVLEICQSDIAAAQVVAQVQLHASTTMVLADAVRLRQVMWNLLKNAIKFSAPGSVISISTTDDSSSHLVITVADQGMGIEPAMMPLIFDCFQQSDLSAHKVHDGLGLGLFIARGLAEAQGGTLTAASEGLNRGATFCLTLNTAPARWALPPTATDPAYFQPFKQPPQK